MGSGGVMGISEGLIGFLVARGGPSGFSRGLTYSLNEWSGNLFTPIVQIGEIRAF